MKIKLKDIFDAREAINALYNNDKITTAESVQIHLEVVKLRPAFDEIASFQKKLIEKYGVESENGRKILKPDSKEGFLAEDEFKEYLENEVEIDIHKCTVSYSPTDKLGICGALINAVSFFINFVQKK